MPVSSLIPAIIGSIIESIVNQPAPPPVYPAAPSWGVVRALPADSLFGEMAPPTPGMVMINGQTMSLAMAAQFRNENDHIVMPGLIRRPVMVRYLVDSTGTVYRVWILSADELAAAR